MATKPTANIEAAPTKVWVRATKGDMLHLYTNVWFTADPKKVEVDDFVRAQLDAGKLTLVVED